MGTTEIVEQLISAVRAAEERGTLTRYELARRSGVPQSTLSRLVNGKRDSLRIETIVALCDALGFTLELRPAKKGTKA